MGVETGVGSDRGQITCRNTGGFGGGLLRRTPISGPLRAINTLAGNSKRGSERARYLSDGTEEPPMTDIVDRVRALHQQLLEDREYEQYVTARTEAEAVEGSLYCDT